MKAFTTACLIYLVTVACRSDQVSPAEGLYKTWESQLSTASPNAVPMPLVLTFRQNGQLAHGADQHEAGCCAPTHFDQSGTQLRFIEAQGREKCALVFCGQSPLIVNGPWTIETLTANELVIRARDQRLTFVSR